MIDFGACSAIFLSTIEDFNVNFVRRLKTMKILSFLYIELRSCI